MGELFSQLILFIYQTVGLQNLGLTIIEIAILTRVVFYPFSKQQAQMSHKMRELAPHLDVLKQKHKDNKQALYQAQMDLYKQHGVNPAGGCLPSVVQIVVLFGLLGAMNKILTMDINTQFLIWDMAKPDAYSLANLPFKIPGILVVLAAVTQYAQMKMMFPAAPKARKDDKPVEKKEKEDFMESFAQSQASMSWMFPLMFLLFGTQWPSGLALYWSVSSVLAIVQQRQVPKNKPASSR